MRQREVKSEFLLALIVAVCLWLVGTLVGLLLPHVVAESIAPKNYTDPGQLILRILIRNLLVSIALVSGAITFGLSTIVSVMLNSITFGRIVFPSVFIFQDQRALVLFTIVLELTSYIACTTVGIYPIVSRIRGLIRSAGRDRSRDAAHVSHPAGDRESGLHIRESIVTVIAISTTLAIAAVSESLVLT